MLNLWQNLQKRQDGIRDRVLMALLLGALFIAACLPQLGMALGGHQLSAKQLPSSLFLTSQIPFCGQNTDGVADNHPNGQHPSPHDDGACCYGMMCGAGAGLPQPDFTVQAPAKLMGQIAARLLLVLAPSVDKATAHQPRAPPKLA